MGLLVQSTSVRAAAKPKLRDALRADPGAIQDEDAAAAQAAAEVEESTRDVSVNLPVLGLAVVFAIVVIVAGIYTEQNAVAGWAERLADLFGAFVPALAGYFAGEFVAEKTK